MWVVDRTADPRIELSRSFCMDETGEAKIWDDFQDVCDALKQEDFVVFHFSSYEKTKLTSLERKYGVTDKAAVENFRRRMVDLHPIVKSSVVLPARGYGLKKIAPFVGLKYSAANAGGAQSIVWFHQYQQNPSDTEVVQRASAIQPGRLPRHEVRGGVAQEPLDWAKRSAFPALTPGNGGGQCYLILTANSPRLNLDHLVKFNDFLSVDRRLTVSSAQRSYSL